MLCILHNLNIQQLGYNFIIQTYLLNCIFFRLKQENQESSFNLQLYLIQLNSKCNFLLFIPPLHKFAQFQNIMVIKFLVFLLRFLFFLLFLFFRFDLIIFEVLQDMCILVNFHFTIKLMIQYFHLILIIIVVIINYHCFKMKRKL